MTQTMRRSHVYVVRTWIEKLGDNQVELRGMVRNVQSGETRYFRTWDALVAFVNDPVVNDPMTNLNMHNLDMPNIERSESQLIDHGQGSEQEPSRPESDE